MATDISENDIMQKCIVISSYPPTYYSILYIVKRYGFSIYREGPEKGVCLTYLFRSNNGLLVRVEIMLSVQNLSFIDDAHT